VPAGASFTERTFNGAAGLLAYKLYVPAGAGSAPLPLVVMLHGCTQSPDDFAIGTRMNELAERDGILVAYPAQSRAANAQKCWNWFRAVDQGRSGEPALIAGMVGQIRREHAVDPARVYVAGLSAGGAAAAVLGQNYPELFAAVGVHSGLACGAAADMASAFAAMRSGAIVPPTGARMPTIVFHGDHDTTVAPVNGEQVVAQAEPAEHLTATIETVTAPGGRVYTRTVQADATGRPLSEHWVLHGAGHAWAGGDPAGSYTDPRGPDASAAMLRFFRHHRIGGRS
jgi:poly(hydroxyalkanoate) depolymerase family esterase